MTFLPELKRLMDAATKGPWFKRYCDDDNHMCMTVISSKDYGPANTGQFKDEPDTIAATFHQSAPVIGDTPDCNEATTDLIIYLVNHAPALAELVEAAEKMNKINGPCDHHDHHGYCQTHFVEEGCTAKALSEALAKLNSLLAGQNGLMFLL